MPEGTTAASSIGGGLVSCEANLTLNTNTEPTRCVIACDESNGYIYQLGTLNCLPTSENGAALITNTNSSTFTCEPVRCSTTIAFTGIESDFRTLVHATQAQMVCVEVKTVHLFVVRDTSPQQSFDRYNFKLNVRPMQVTTLDWIYLKRLVRNVIVGITLTVQAQMLAHLARKIHLQAFRVELNVSSALPVRSVRIISH